MFCASCRMLRWPRRPFSSYPCKNSVETIWGIDYASFNALRPFVFLSGGPFQGPNDVIVDDIFARSDKHYSVGETIQMLDHPFRICGIVEHGKGGRKYLPIRTLGALLGAENNASIIFVKSDDPKTSSSSSRRSMLTRGCLNTRCRRWRNRSPR